MAEQLIVKLGLDRQAFDKGIGSARGAITKLAGAFGLAGAGFGIGKLIADTLAYADNVKTLSAELGVSTGLIQKWWNAAEQGGVAVSRSTVGLEKFVTVLGQANAKAGEQRDAFARLNVAIRDGTGHYRSTEDVLRDVLDAFQNTTDWQNRAYDASLLFGRGAVQLTAALPQLQEALDETANSFEGLTEAELASLDALDKEWKGFARNRKIDFAQMMVAVWEGSKLMLGAIKEVGLLKALTFDKSLVGSIQRQTGWDRLGKALLGSFIRGDSGGAGGGPPPPPPGDGNELADALDKVSKLEEQQNKLLERRNQLEEQAIKQRDTEERERANKVLGLSDRVFTRAGWENVRRAQMAEQLDRWADQAELNQFGNFAGARARASELRAGITAFADPSAQEKTARDISETTKAVLQIGRLIEQGMIAVTVANTQ